MFWVRTRDPKWAEQQEAEGRKQHGSSTRGVSVGCAIFILPHTGHLHGPCKRENGLHGSSTRGVSVRRAIFILPHMGRAAQHGPCCSFGLHGSQKGLARGVFVILATRGVQIDTGRPWIYTGRVIFFFWGRKPNLFSVFRVYYDLRILIGLIKDPMNEIGWVEDLIVNPDNPNWELDWELWNWEAGNLIDSLDGFNSV